MWFKLSNILVLMIIIKMFSSYLNLYVFWEVCEKCPKPFKYIKNCWMYFYMKILILTNIYTEPFCICKIYMCSICICKIHFYIQWIKGKPMALNWPHRWIDYLDLMGIMCVLFNKAHYHCIIYMIPNGYYVGGFNLKFYLTFSQRIFW